MSSHGATCSGHMLTFLRTVFFQGALISWGPWGPEKSNADKGEGLQEEMCCCTRLDGWSS